MSFVIKQFKEYKVCCVLACVCLLAILNTQSVSAYPEQGLFTYRLSKDQDLVFFHRTMFNGTVVHVDLECDAGKDFNITWFFRETSCLGEYPSITRIQVARYMMDPTYKLQDKCVHFATASVSQSCVAIHFDIYEKQPQLICNKNWKSSLTGKSIATPISNSTLRSGAPSSLAVAQPIKSRQRREISSKQSAISNRASNAKSGPIRDSHFKHKSFSQVVKAWADDIYLFALKANFKENFEVTVNIYVQLNDDYLSAKDYPLLPFYSVMCAVYTLYALGWLLVSCCYWRDMLRVQYWIGLVILLGLIEKAFFLGEYSSLHQTGQSVRGVMYCAEIISALKRALARVLVVIVSLGFGIVKPRLGPVLHRVLAMGALYFVLASVEGCLRLQSHSRSANNKDLIVAIPLNLLDALIFYWVFVSITQTLRTLRLRRNVVKLTLYRHFTNCLIFSLLAAVIFMIWSINQYRTNSCPKAWKEAWLDDAYWHLLFSIILLVIIILWRPSQNNQRYAYSPLLDAAGEEEEEEEFTKSGAYENMKSRGRSPSRRRSGNERTMDDDLKWVEENIPTSAADSVLPVLDSDEEVLTTRLELSKME